MTAMPDTLDDVFAHAWARLRAGVAGRHDPFHQGVLANAGADGPQARYVVLRGADPARGELAFHTDRRSPKVAALAADPRLAWVFFGHGEQLRIEGRATLHHDDAEADAAWTALRPLARRTYAVPLPPGTGVATPAEAGLPGLSSPPDPGALDAARARFVLARVRATRLDWLSLAASGHRRARFERDGDGWRGAWLAP
jgi:pyridoxine/pyridoxamine 5'-phosphate oxidase